MKLGGNGYNLRKRAGAFGDHGILILCLVGYLTIINNLTGDLPCSARH
jgi:hypothetical protein